MFTPKIGYPKKWRDYSSLEIRRDDLVGNVRRADRLRVGAQTLAKLGKPVDRDEWGMTPQTVNAYYNPHMNEIVFPAAILQPPFFDLAADDAVNYGGIGAVIGHEIGHGFDDQGSKWDGDGNMTDWWTPADRAEFDKRGDALAAQYDQFEPFPGFNVNGRLTLGENMGDLAGALVAHEAYRLSLRGAGGPGDRRPDRRPAVLHGLGADLALQGPRRGAEGSARDRPPLARRVSAPTGRCATSRRSTRRSASRKATSSTCPPPSEPGSGERVPRPLQPASGLGKPSSRKLCRSRVRWRASAVEMCLDAAPGEARFPMTTGAHDHPEPADPAGSPPTPHAPKPAAEAGHGGDAHAAGHAHDAHGAHAAGHDSHAAHDAGHDAHGAGHDAHGAGHDAHGAGHDAHGAGHGGHAPHAGHLGRNVGITMAVMGVLLAFASALVGGERTELVSAMIEHTSTSGRYQAISTKYRVLQAQLQQLHATMPREAELQKNEVELKKAEAEIARLEVEAKIEPHASLAMRSLRLETKRIIDTVAPTRSDLLRLAKLVRQYGKERESAREWAESYEGSVKVHETAAEHYELAALFAEIGIVMASIALLLHSRKAWLAAMVFGATSVTVLALTGTSCSMRLKAADHKVEEARAAYVLATANGTEEADDEKLLRVITGQEEESVETATPAGEHGQAAPPTEHGEHGGEHH